MASPNRLQPPPTTNKLNLNQEIHHEKEIKIHEKESGNESQNDTTIHQNENQNEDQENHNQENHETPNQENPPKASHKNPAYLQENLLPASMVTKIAKGVLNENQGAAVSKEAKEALIRACTGRNWHRTYCSTYQIPFIGCLLSDTLYWIPFIGSTLYAFNRIYSVCLLSDTLYRIPFIGSTLYLYL